MRRRAVLAVAAGSAWAWAALAEAPGFSNSIRVLGEQRSQSEQLAGLLKRYAPDDIEARALYARAKAAFDGLIEQLLADLAQGRSPEVSDAFRASLDAAVARRAEFSAHAEAALGAVVPAGARPAWLDLIAKVPADLVKVLVNSGIAIWREWAKAAADRQRDITTRVEAQRWKPWADIPAAL